MKEVILATIAGMIIGFVFKIIKLPIPAPPVLSGVMGVVGVYLGAIAWDKLAHVLHLAGK